MAEGLWAELEVKKEIRRNTDEEEEWDTDVADENGSKRMWISCGLRVQYEELLF